MPDKTYRLTINKSDNTSDVVTFTIPATAGTYNLSFTNSSGQTINAGNIVVGNSVKTYSLTLGLSNGTTINCGTIETPTLVAEKSLKSFINDELTSITADDLGNITTITNYAFMKKQNLTSIILPESVTTIGSYAFALGDIQQFDLDLIQFGSNVTTIGDSIFSYNSNTGFSASAGGHISVMRVLATTPPSVSSSFIYSSTTMTTLTIDRIEVPSASLAAYQAADIWKDYNLVGV